MMTTFTSVRPATRIAAALENRVVQVASRVLDREARALAAEPAPLEPDAHGDQDEADDEDRAGG